MTLLILNVFLCIFIFHWGVKELTMLHKAVYMIYALFVIFIDLAVLLYSRDESDYCRDCGKVTKWKELKTNMQTQPYYDDICNECWVDKY